MWKTDPAKGLADMLAIWLFIRNKRSKGDEMIDIPTIHSGMEKVRKLKAER
jgi:hypothetical protein